jgi:hypothetical protein
VLPQNIGNPHDRPKGTTNTTPAIEEQHQKIRPQTESNDQEIGDRHAAQGNV